MKLRFRDGEREVPDGVGALVKHLDIRRMTYDEAIAAGNRQQFADFVNGVQNTAIREHMDMLRRG